MTKLLRKKNFKSKRLIALAFYTNQTGDVTSKFDNKAILSMASDRMQFKPAVNAAKDAGLQTCIYSLHNKNSSQIFDLGKADACLVTKMSANTKELNISMITANLAALCLLKSEAKILVQYCDNMFAKPTSNNYNHELTRFMIAYLNSPMQ